MKFVFLLIVIFIAAPWVLRFFGPALDFCFSWVLRYWSWVLGEEDNDC